VGERTRGKRLLELLGLVGVLEDEGVDVPRAADLELDVVDLLVLLDARGCHSLVLALPLNGIVSQRSSAARVPSVRNQGPEVCPRILTFPPLSSELLLLRCAGWARTLGVLAAADLDELLDVGNFGRHFGGIEVETWDCRASLEVRKSAGARPNRCGLA
jgi:hypothetical protein